MQSKSDLPAGMTPSDERPTRSASTAAVLARGGYAVLLTAAGGGGSSYRGFALTRWTADRTRDADGFFVYLRDADSGDVWSAGHQPVGRPADAYDARLADGRAEIIRRDGAVETRLEVRLVAEGDAELRRITLTNHGGRPRRIEVTTCAELVLNTPAGDAAHPAFSKLFVQTGWMADRRPSSPGAACAAPTTSRSGSSTACSRTMPPRRSTRPIARASSAAAERWLHRRRWMQTRGFPAPSATCWTPYSACAAP